MSIMLQAQERRAATTREEADPAITERLSALPEDYILMWFWDMVRGTDDRLGLLLQLTQVVVARPATWSKAAIRREHDHRSTWSVITIDRKRCFGCQSDKQLYFHHIVEVQNGGSNTARNFVPLCFLCHQYLHPWLTDEPPARVRGFESLGQILPRALEKVTG